MACLILKSKNEKIYRMVLSHAINLAESDRIRDNFRFIASVLFAHCYDNGGVKVQPKDDYLVDVLLSEQYAKTGYVTLSDESIVICSYAGFEKLTSKWAKENCLGCRGVITIRVCKFDKHLNVLDAHSVSIYF